MKKLLYIMLIDNGTDSQPELLHDTENEYLELANNAQNHINHLNSTITDYRLENKILDERVEFLTSEIIKIGAQFQKYYTENVALRVQLCKISKDNIQRNNEIIKCYDKIIELEECIKKHKKNFKDAISMPLTSNKREKTKLIQNS